VRLQKVNTRYINKPVSIQSK